MKRLLQLTLWLSLFTILGGVTNSYAQEVKRTALEVTNEQVDSDKVSDAKEESVKVGFSLYNAGKITVTDKETQKEIEIAGNACNVVVGHTIIINGEGQDGMKFVKGSFAKPYQSPSFFEQLPMEIAVPKEGLKIMLRFGHIIEFGVRGEGGKITAQKTEEEDDEWGDTDEFTSDINSGDSFNVGDVTKVTFHATSNEGYLIKAWYLNGEIQQGRENSFTVKNPQKSLKVEVEFEAVPIKHFAVSLTATPMKGAKELWIAQAANKNNNFVKVEGLSSELEEGMSVEFNINVNDGYAFDGFYIGSDKQVSEGDQSKGFRLVIDRLDKAINVIAKMNAIITFAVEGDKNGSLTAQIDDKSIKSGSGIESGKSILLTATPNDKFIIKRWIVDGKDLTLEDGSLNTDQTINLTMGEDPKDVKVEFMIAPKKKYQIIATTSDKELGSFSIFDITSGNKNEVANESSLEEGTELLFVLDLKDNVKVDTVTVNNQKGINLDEKMSFKINLNDTNCKEGKLTVFAKLINTESTSAVMNTTKVYAIENEVYIETTTSTSYQIFTIGGKKIKQGIANTHDSFRLNSGAYIVVIDNKVFKLLVK
ncbi:InlB B-repeat-containing protein [Falsiporphyromonas endometrii]|uniref:Bacterial repeat domain-containing protein n=1 Tax=Falsiporphyromonas endometrii TaxID=1387297 RepID=A0ABV9K8L1_9PORP